MLQDIRDKSQGVIAKVIVGLIVAVFALWGVESIIGGFVQSPSVAEVNGEEITEQQLTINTQNLLASIGGNPGSIDQSLLEQIALSQLVEEVLLRQAAENASMRISDDRIDKSILENPQFSLNGVFDSDLAVRTIAAQQMNVPIYREQLKKNMLLSQIANAFSSSNFITQSELERIAALRLQSRDIRFISLTLGTRTLGEAIPDAEIESYYQANQQEFTIAEMVRVQYVELSKAAIMNEIQIEDSLVTEQYTREKESFEGSVERRASHILFEVGPNLSEAEALQQAAAAKQRLDQGEDFSTLAEELSSDTLSAENGGDIGYSDGTAFPEAIEIALLEMSENQISDPVVSEFGVHLVMLTEDSVNEYAPFEEVSARIINDLKSEQVELIYAQRLEDLSNMAFESTDLSAISDDLSLEIQESEPFSRLGGSGLFSNPMVIAEAFSEEVLESGFNSDVIELNDAQALVIHSLDRTPASIRPLEEVEGEIAVVLRTELERERAQQLGQNILAELRAGQPVDQILIDNELEWIAQNGLTRDSTAVNREITNVVFGLPSPAGNPVFDGFALSNGTYVVIELNNVNTGNLAELDETEKASVVTSLLSNKSQSEFGAYLGSLRENADISTRLVEATQ